MRASLPCVVRAAPARAMAGLVAATLAIVLLDRLLPPPLANAAETGALLYDRDGDLLHAIAADGGVWRFAVAIDDVDPTFIDRLLLVEDKRFFAHPGVDPIALARALGDAVRTGEITSGASTITMQTARLLEPRARTIPAKIIEMLRALQIERRLTKDEILALYLTRAPYGGNIEGLRAASLIYFGKEPSRLNSAEQALLLALPQAPEARRPDRHPNAARDGVRLIAAKLAETSAALDGVEAPIPVRRRILPHRAYHAARHAVRSARADGVSDVTTTIDAPLQMAAQEIVRAHAEQSSDGATAAALVVDAATGEVLAHVGSSGRDAPGGWIDLAQAVRSPGSTLKPFVYAAAFDDGRLAPETVVTDGPRAFDGYAPENFDRIFRGEVRVRDALRHSLNLPAVAALEAVGPRRFGASLQAAGVRLALPRRADDTGPGLPTALGGAGLRLTDLARLYVGLARGGVAIPLTWRPGSPEDQGMAASGYQLMSAATAVRITDILRGAPAPPGRAPAKLAEGAPIIAYKTGTSYGFRDALAIGSAGGLTIAVWSGRADGAPRPGRTGLKEAAPLLFDLFDAAARLDRLQLEGTQANDLALVGSAPHRRQPMTDPLQLIHPTEGSELFADARGVALAARGGRPPRRWYVDGAPAAKNGDRALWRPETAGFYEVTVVDADGQSASAAVRVRSAVALAEDPRVAPDDG
ncbi:MAG: penicillin-binding protein 1C [Pseudomonadota bacterium]